MGDSSGGAPPGPSGLNNVKDLLQKTKKQYNLIHPDKRWPCPFCLHIAKTLFQCQIHIRIDHANLAKGNTQNFLSQYDKADNSSTSAKQNLNNVIPPDLTEFLQLINDATCNEPVYNASASQTASSTNIFNLVDDDVDDEETFYCPYDCKIKKPFRSLRGLNIHIGKMHPGKKKIKRDEIQYEYVSNAEDDLTDFGQKLAFLRGTTATLRRCPKGARFSCCADKRGSSSGGQK